MPNVWMYSIQFDRSTERLIYRNIYEKGMSQEEFDKLSTIDNWNRPIKINFADTHNMFDGNSWITFIHPNRTLIECVADGIMLAYELDNGRNWDNVMYKTLDKATKNEATISGEHADDFIN